MNDQQKQFLQMAGINPAQIEAIQAQAAAARSQHGHGAVPGGGGMPNVFLSTGGNPSQQIYPPQYQQQQYQQQQYQQQPMQPMQQPTQPIVLTMNPNGTISGLENLRAQQAAGGMMQDPQGVGGAIKIPSPFKDPNGRSRPPETVYARYLIVLRDGARLAFIPERFQFVVNGVPPQGFNSPPIYSFPRRPVRPIQSPRGMRPTDFTSTQSTSSSFGSSPPSVTPSAPPEPPRVIYHPRTETGFMTKLGWKKTFLGADSWQRRYFSLSATHLTYSPKEFDDESQRKHIPITKNCQVKIVDRWHNALANRYEGGDWGSDRPIGFDNCVELQCPDIGRSGRTFYLVAETLQDARKWCDAIMNNINALPEEEEDDEPQNSAGNNPFGAFSGGFFSNAFAAVGGALAFSSRQAELEDPYKSFDFMKACLQSSVSDTELAYEFSLFFDRLEDEVR